MGNEKTIEIDIDNDIVKKVFGFLDSNIKIIEKHYNVSILSRDEKVKIIGPGNNVDKAKNVLTYLSNLAKNQDIFEQEVRYAISLNEEDSLKGYVEIDNDIICRTYLGKPIKAKTLGQIEYINSIKNNMVTFGVGPAGTGKTYLAMCMAIQAFKNGDVSHMILTRPAIEAGEKLGFLPGDLQSKVDPYLRPLYDALYEILGAESFQSNLEKGNIEVAPLAYMRGRTLNNSYIILDEAQNTTIPQMKMFLTRIGFNSKVVITGDDTQIDLAPNIHSGLNNALKILDNVEGIGITRLTGKDVVRHPIVQRIIGAYEKYEMKNKENFEKNDKKSFHSKDKNFKSKN